MKDIGSGARSILLGSGIFTGPTSGEKIHSYTLELFFPVNGGDQCFD
ncbi:MAG: hypothetical protein PHS24_03690 [Bacilli bacterium]|nr:hypothetical protein [Bacilli bacterium]